jgi:succinoglycan biosynthesis transport protein ExoP
MGNTPQKVATEWADAPGARTGFNPLQAAWQRRSLVLLGVVVGLALGGLYYAQTTPAYESKAQVLVVKKRPDDVTGMDTRHLEVEDYVATQREIIRSQLVVERAVKKPELASLSLAAEVESQTDALLSSLQITRNKGPSGYNNVLDLSLRTKAPDEAAVVLNALIDSYKEFLEETYHSMSDSTLDLVRKARDEVLQEILRKEAAYREFQEKSPLVRVGKERGTLWQDRLSGIESRRVALLLVRAEVEGQLSVIENARKEKLPRETILALIASHGGKGEDDNPRRVPATALREHLSPLLAEEQKLAAVYGPRHPELVALRQEIERARVFYASPAASWGTASNGQGDAVPAADPVEDHVRYLRQQLKQLQTSERLLGEAYDQEHTSAKKLATYEAQDEAFRTDIGRLNNLYDGIVKQLQNVRMVRDVGGYEAKVLNSPSPGRKVAPKATLIFPAAALLGLLLGGVLACFAEVTDKRFRSADEIRGRLGAPVLGYIPRLRGGEVVPPAGDKKRTLDAVLSTYHYSKSTAAEAYRAVRTALYFSNHGEGQRILQITSPGTGDGKSTLAANLAICIAQSGQRVLLIDADLRKPRLHQLFAVPADRGLSSVITGKVEAGQAVQESGVPGLRLLPCGPLPTNPAELLTSPRFAELLAFLRTQYDFVIVDTPPLLEVTDPGVVAPRVDGVLLAIRPRNCTRSSAERAREILGTLGARLVGVVVNGAERVGSA